VAPDRVIVACDQVPNTGIQDRLAMLLSAWVSETNSTRRTHHPLFGHTLNFRRTAHSAFRGEGGLRTCRFSFLQLAFAARIWIWSIVDRGGSGEDEGTVRVGEESLRGLVSTS